MKIKSVINDFYTHENWKPVRNRQSNNIWFDSGSECKIHVELTDGNEYCIRLYKFESPTINNTERYYRISIDDVNIEIHDFRMNSNIDDGYVGISEYKSLTESKFFQESLLTNFADLEFSDIEMCIALRNKFTELYKVSMYV